MNQFPILEHQYKLLEAAAESEIKKFGEVSERTSKELDEHYRALEILGSHDDVQDAVIKSLNLIHKIYEFENGVSVDHYYQIIDLLGKAHL